MKISLKFLLLFFAMFAIPGIVFAVAPSSCTKVSGSSQCLWGDFDIAVNNNTLTGWACDPNNPSAAPTLTFKEYSGTSNGKAVYLTYGNAFANQDGSVAVAQKCAGNGKHKFSFALPAYVQDGKPHIITLFATTYIGYEPLPINFIVYQKHSGPCTPNWQTGIWGSCVNGQKTRSVLDLNYCGSTANMPDTFSACTSTGVVFGKVDQTEASDSNNTITGYACDSNDFSWPLDIIFQVEKNILVQAKADLDGGKAVADKCGGNPKHAFSVKINGTSSLVFGGNPHPVSVFAMPANSSGGTAFQIGSFIYQNCIPNWQPNTKLNDCQYGSSTRMVDLNNCPGSNSVNMLGPCLQPYNISVSNNNISGSFCSVANNIPAYTSTKQLEYYVDDSANPGKQIKIGSGLANLGNGGVCQTSTSYYFSYNAASSSQNLNDGKSHNIYVYAADFYGIKNPNNTLIGAINYGGSGPASSVATNVPAQSTVTTNANNACVPNWQPGSWGDCINGIQNRQVTDLNKCPLPVDITYRPETIKKCAVASEKTVQSPATSVAIAKLQQEIDKIIKKIQDLTAVSGSGATPGIACSKDSECGTTDWVGMPSCALNMSCSGASCPTSAIWQNYITATCVIPAGKTAGTCSKTTEFKQKQACSLGQVCTEGFCLPSSCKNDSECGTTKSWTGDQYCQYAGTKKGYSEYQVYQDQTSFLCKNSQCTTSLAPVMRKACANGEVCLSNACVAAPAVMCSKDADCGTNGPLLNSKSCNGYGYVQQSILSYTCENPGTSSAKCISISRMNLSTYCDPKNNLACYNGACVKFIPYTQRCSTEKDCGSGQICQFAMKDGNGNDIKQCVAKPVQQLTPIGVATPTAPVAQRNYYCSETPNCPTGYSCLNNICTYTAKPGIKCMDDFDCGGGASTVGAKSCDGNDVYEQYISQVCKNPGTTSSYCDKNTKAQFLTTCPSNMPCKTVGASADCVAAPSTAKCQTNTDCGTQITHGTPHCQGNYSVWTDTGPYCNYAGTSSAYCTTASSTSQLACSDGCNSSTGKCITKYECYSDAECGGPSNDTAGFCGEDNNVYYNHIVYRCANAGTALAHCTGTQERALTQKCGSGFCQNGMCLCSYDRDCDWMQSASYSCQGNVYYKNIQNYVCQNPNTASAQCVASPNLVSSVYRDCGALGQICQKGGCAAAPVQVSPNAACYKNADCPAPTGTTQSLPYCSSGNVMVNKLVPTCMLPGQSGAYCKNVSTPTLLQKCMPAICSNGKCTYNGISEIDAIKSQIASIADTIKAILSR